MMSTVIVFDDSGIRHERSSRVGFEGLVREGKLKLPISTRSKIYPFLKPVEF